MIATMPEKKKTNRIIEFPRPNGARRLPGSDPATDPMRMMTTTEVRDVQGELYSFGGTLKWWDGARCAVVELFDELVSDASNLRGFEIYFVTKDHIEVQQKGGRVVTLRSGEGIADAISQLCHFVTNRMAAELDCTQNDIVGLGEELQRVAEEWAREARREQERAEGLR